MKSSDFYRFEYLTDLARILPLRTIFTTRPEEFSNRQPTHFATDHPQGFGATFARGLKIGRHKVTFAPGRLIGTRPDLALVYLLDDVVSLQIMARLHHLDVPYILSVDGVGRRNRTIDAAFAPHIRHAAGFLSPNALADGMIAELGGRSSITRYHLGSRRAAEIDKAPTATAGKVALRRRLGLPDDLPTILSVGQIIRRKGFDTLLDAMRLVPQACSIVIVGGDPTEELAQHVAELPPRHVVTFAPHVDKSLLESYYRTSDVFALATRGDSWGLVINEALGHGLPVVTTTACGAGNELIDASCGALVPPNDAAALARELQALIDDSDLRARMSLGALAAAQTCTVEQMVDQTIQAIRICDQPVGPRGA